MTDATAAMLAHALLATRRDVLTCHPRRLELALGRDRRRVAEALAWASDGDPGRVYATATDARTRALFEAVYPNLVATWQALYAQQEGGSDRD